MTDLQKHVAELHSFSLALTYCLVHSLVHSPHSFQSNSSSSSLFSAGYMQCIRRVRSHGTPTVSCLLSVTHQWHLPFSSSHFSSLSADTEVLGNICSLYCWQSSSGLRFPRKNLLKCPFYKPKTFTAPSVVTQHSFYVSVNTHCNMT